MNKYASQDLRNICLVGPQGEGKTTLLESMLFRAGAVSRRGTVEEGTTTSDHTDEERERGMSVHLSVSHLEYKGKKINVIDTPGYADFEGDMRAGLAAADAAVLVISGAGGISPAVEGYWEFLREAKLPVAVFLNKMDKGAADFNRVYHEVQERIGREIVDIDVPEYENGALKSEVSLLQERVPDEDIPLRDMMVEEISSGDDDLTEEFLEGKPIAPEKLAATLKKEIKSCTVFPLLTGSAERMIGVEELMDFIADYLPAPDVPAGDSKFSGLIFKTVSEPGMGHLNYIRIFSGALQTGKDIMNCTRQTHERVGQMAALQGKKRIDVHDAVAGDIVGLSKLKDTRTNDILAEAKEPPALKRIVFPASIYERSIVASSKTDDEKIGAALAALTLEDPSVHHRFSAETHEMILAGLGSLQLEILAKKIKARYNAGLELKPPRIPYHETVRGTAEAQGKYKRQTGGHGQYGDCWLRVEPRERGKGFEFVEKIVGGAIPRNFIPAIEKGVREAMGQGVIAGYPVVDARVTVYDGSYHDVDSSEMAFKIAAAMALRKCVAAARPHLLEPIMEVAVTAGDEYTGPILGDLTARRGKVLGMDKNGRKEVVRAYVPQSEIFNYATELRSLTRGTGRFSLKHSHYEELPPDRAQPLIQEYQKTHTASEA